MFYSLVWCVSHRQSLTTQVNSFFNFQGFISCGSAGSREIHSDRDAFIWGQRLYKFMHFLMICLIKHNNNNKYIFISFNTVCVIPVYAALLIFMMPVGDMSTFLVEVCDEDRRGQSICLQNIL